MRIAVIGGKLQGLEAVYLARKAGWDVTLIDKKDDVPARNLANHFICFDIYEKRSLMERLSNIDLVIPALENRMALDWIAEYTTKAGLPLAFDNQAFAISSSKSISDHLFSNIGVPAPKPWPDCDFPLIAKPSGSSGSEGVVLVKSALEFDLFRRNLEQDIQNWVIQEYLEGPSYSIEVIGVPGNYKTLQVTELEMDESYDCKRVSAPVSLSDAHLKRFSEIAVKIAQSINLKGIMDVEVILHKGELKVLEIDARLPSQTPITVYNSTGVNIVEELADIFIEGRNAIKIQKSPGEKTVIFEHINVTEGKLTVSGEHIIAAAGPLDHQLNFFGADEALTNYTEGSHDFVATLICVGSSRKDVWKERNKVIQQILSRFEIKQYEDKVPELDRDKVGV